MHQAQRHTINEYVMTLFKRAYFDESGPQHMTSCPGCDRVFAMADIAQLKRHRNCAVFLYKDKDKKPAARVKKYSYPKIKCPICGEEISNGGAAKWSHMSKHEREKKKD